MPHSQQSSTALHLVACSAGLYDPSYSQTTSTNTTNHGQANRGLCGQGLQEEWRRSSSRETHSTSDSRRRRRSRRHVVVNNSRTLRLSRRMWLRSQHCGGQQTHQQCSRTRRHSASSFARSVMVLLLMLLLLLLGCTKVQGFGMMRPCRSLISCRSTERAEEEFEQELGEIVGEDAGGVLVEDLHWRVERLRLEEQNTKRFLKAGPRFLPYDECRKWVQAWNRWDCEEDWRNWIAMGEKRNPYIPSEPDVYYGKLGEWISWEHFLGKDS